MNAGKAQKELRLYTDKERARHSQRFFKTGEGEYGEGDKFIGVTVPDIRKVARTYSQLPVGETKKLLHSEIHEDRLLALIILLNQFKKAGKNNDTGQQQKIFDFYLGEYKYINNWDLVDVSCRDIVGAYLFDKPAEDKKLLVNWAKSSHLWKRRIAIISTAYFIAKNRFDETLELARILLNDEHDLIHKATGWMLREVGKRNLDTLIDFLDQHYQNMPRTMLRYAIERLDEDLRQDYLKGRR